jgi:hypothetical protein
MLRAALATLVAATVATSAGAQPPQSIGVPACDDLLSKMYSCALKEPGMVQTHSKQITALTRRQAADMLRQFGQKEAADFCKAMLHGYKSTGYSKEYGCSF